MMILTPTAVIGRVKKANDRKIRAKEERKEAQNVGKKNALAFFAKELERAKVLAKERAQADKEIAAILFDKDDKEKKMDEEEPRFLKTRHDEDEE